MIDISRGVFLVTLDAITFLIPDSVILGVIPGDAVVVVVLGGIVLAYGIRAQSDEELTDVDAASASQLLIDWIRTRDVGDARRDDIGEGLFFEAPDRLAKLTASDRPCWRVRSCWMISGPLQADCEHGALQSRTLTRRSCSEGRCDCYRPDRVICVGC